MSTGEDGEQDSEVCCARRVRIKLASRSPAGQCVWGGGWGWCLWTVSVGQLPLLGSELYDKVDTASCSVAEAA